MKHLSLLLIALMMAGDAYAGTGWKCERGNGSIVRTISCCGNDGKFYGIASNDDYPSKCDERGDNDSKKCCSKKDWFGNCEIKETNQEEISAERSAMIPVCEARGKKEDFKGYPVLEAYDSCADGGIPCITYHETGKFYKP